MMVSNAVCGFQLLLIEYDFQHLSVHSNAVHIVMQRQTDEYIIVPSTFQTTHKLNVIVPGTFKNKLTPLRRGACVFMCPQMHVRLSAI